MPFANWRPTGSAGYFSPRAENQSEGEQFENHRKIGRVTDDPKRTGILFTGVPETALPVAEKLRMLDALRERELAIRGRAVHSDSSGLREEPAPYLSRREER
jgi:hypothetical protein